MKRALFVALGVIVALQPVQASAQLLQGGVSAQEYLQFLSGSGVGSTWGPQVGEYKGRFNASATRAAVSNNFGLFCVDYLHYASYSTGAVNIAGLSGDVGSLSTTRLGLGGAAKYRQAAYLASLFDSWDDYGTNKQLVWSGLHAAIWKLTSDVNKGSVATALLRESFYAMAVPGGFTGDGWYVVSRDIVGSSTGKYDRTGQEFLMRRSVPEPGTILLLVTGLFLLVVVRRKKLFEVA